MELKSLLYIDVLGFSNLVRNNPTKVRRIYKIIEDLNCHRHDSFKTIVFSDTILVYNIDDYLWELDKKYFIQYLIEFTHNLFNEFAGKEFHFKAIILEGEFENNQPKNIERYFGKALIDAYEDQKKINCMGLFIEKKLNQYNQIYATTNFNDKYDFVFLTHSLEVLREEYGNQIPYEKYAIYDTDFPYDLIRYVHYFKNLYKNIAEQLDPRVKNKYKSTYCLYKTRYKKFINALEKNNFSPKAICNDINWSEYEKKIKYSIGGYGIKPPSSTDFKNIIERAREAGKEAAKKFCENKYKTKGLKDFEFLPCGGAWIVLDVYPKTKLGRFMISEGKNLNRVKIANTGKNSIHISIYDMNNTQAKIFDEIAYNEALKIIKKELDVEGYVYLFWD